MPWPAEGATRTKQRTAQLSVAAAASLPGAGSPSSAARSARYCCGTAGTARQTQPPAAAPRWPSCWSSRPGRRPRGRPPPAGSPGCGAGASWAWQAGQARLGQGAVGWRGHRRMAGVCWAGRQAGGGVTPAPHRLVLLLPPRHLRLHALRLQARAQPHAPQAVAAEEQHVGGVDGVLDQQVGPGSDQVVWRHQAVIGL